MDLLHFCLHLLLNILTDSHVYVIILPLAALFFLWRSPKRQHCVQGQSLVITGCDTGMGHRMALQFDKLGMHVFAGCLDPKGPGSSTLREKCSDRLHILPLDITKSEMVRDAVSYVTENLPNGQKGLNCLINNAGVFLLSSLDLVSMDDCRKMIDVNVTGTIDVTKSFLPLLKKCPGRIVVISSIVSRFGFPQVAVYAATKHALNGFFSSLRFELGLSDVQLSIVEPGDFSRITDIMKWTKQHHKEVLNQMPPEKQEKNRLRCKLMRRVANFQMLTPAEQEAKYQLLLSNVEDAVLADQPRFRYVCAPFFEKLCFAIFRNLPERAAFKILSALQNPQTQEMADKIYSTIYRQKMKIVDHAGRP